MDYKTKLLNLIEENDGLILTKQAEAKGIPRQFLIELMKDGLIERAAHGVYVSPDAFEDEMYMLQATNSRAIFSHETALYLHDLTDRDPINLTVTVPSGYNSAKLRDSWVKVYFIKKEFHELGVIESKTPFGRPIRIYDKERTICDIVRSRNSIDISIFYVAIRRYISSKDKNIHLLMRYAKELKVQNILRNYLEVLI